MSLYAIGDLHLSFAVEKPMDVFGGNWINYVEKIKDGFSKLAADDTVVLCGDSSWGDSLESAKDDFAFIDALPGKKIILKGNHDYWWQTAKKMNSFFTDCGFSTLNILHNNSFQYEKAAICGTRGWFYEESAQNADDKVYKRELIRLEASLKMGLESGAAEILAFLHYPPVYMSHIYTEILDILTKYGVKRCFYGHLHGHSISRATEGDYAGIDFSLVSGDHLDFKPLKII